jgi:hypothetical protein
MINQTELVDPLFGVPTQQQAQLPQTPSNELGYAKPVFNPKDQAIAKGIFGDTQQKQNSVSPQFINPTY